MRVAAAALGVWMLEWSLHVGHAWRVTIDNSHAENSFVADHDVRVGNSQFGDEAVGVDCTTANFQLGPQTFAPFDASLVLELNEETLCGSSLEGKIFLFPDDIPSWRKQTWKNLVDCDELSTDPETEDSPWHTVWQYLQRKNATGTVRLSISTLGYFLGYHTPASALPVDKLLVLDCRVPLSVNSSDWFLQNTETVAHVEDAQSDFKALFRSTAYQATFGWILPFIFLCISLQAIYFLRQYFYEVPNRRNHLFMAALFVNSYTTATCSIFLFIEAFQSRGRLPTLMSLLLWFAFMTEGLVCILLIVVSWRSVARSIGEEMRMNLPRFTLFSALLILLGPAVNLILLLGIVPIHRIALWISAFFMLAELVCGIRFLVSARGFHKQVAYLVQAIASEELILRQQIVTRNMTRLGCCLLLMFAFTALFGTGLRLDARYMPVIVAGALILRAALSYVINETSRLGKMRSAPRPSRVRAFSQQKFILSRNSIANSIARKSTANSTARSSTA